MAELLNAVKFGRTFYVYHHDEDGRLRIEAALPMGMTSSDADVLRAIERDQKRREKCAESC